MKPMSGALPCGVTGMSLQSIAETNVGHVEEKYHLCSSLVSAREHAVRGAGSSRRLSAEDAERPHRGCRLLLPAGDVPYDVLPRRAEGTGPTADRRILCTPGPLLSTLLSARRNDRRGPGSGGARRAAPDSPLNAAFRLSARRLAAAACSALGSTSDTSLQNFPVLVRAW